jgi:hypothetical protein
MILPRPAAAPVLVPAADEIALLALVNVSVPSFIAARTEGILLHGITSKFSKRNFRPLREASGGRIYADSIRASSSGMDLIPFFLRVCFRFAIGVPTDGQSPAINALLSLFRRLLSFAVAAKIDLVIVFHEFFSCTGSTKDTPVSSTGGSGTVIQIEAQRWKR